MTKIEVKPKFMGNVWGPCSTTAQFYFLFEVSLLLLWKKFKSTIYILCYSF